MISAHTILALIRFVKHCIVIFFPLGFAKIDQDIKTTSKCYSNMALFLKRISVRTCELTIGKTLKLIIGTSTTNFY